MMMKRAQIITFGVLTLLLLFPLIVRSQGFNYSLNNDPFLIVLDAGHGGHDAGTSGIMSKEKDLALKVAIEVGQQLEELTPHIKVVYTRKSDVFIPLNQRIALANELNADIFVSIHCNSFSGDDKASGTETFVMGLHSSEENLEVAKRENASILYENNYEESYSNFDPFSVEGHILLSAMQNSHLGQSISIAERIQKEVKSNTNMMDRGVRQAGFLLLRKATMPSVLVEAAFLSNPRDEAYLLSAKGLTEVSNSIARGIKSYALDIVSQRQELSRQELTRRAQVAERSIESKEVVQPEQKRALDVIYKVQIASSKKSVSGDTFAKVDPDLLEIHRENELYKYTVGQFDALPEAVIKQSDLRKSGFKGAFVVAYQNGKRVRLSDVLAEQKSSEAVDVATQQE